MRAIEVEGLTKRYGGQAAVDGLCMNVEQGELFALLGVNGAGKSTTIRMLTGITEPDGGDARLMGKSIRTQLREVKRISSLSPQESAVAGKLSVRENLEFMAGIYGMDRAAARRRAGELMDELELEQVAKKRAGVLSGGWQRRLSVAMALVPGPEILFLDEPTLGLDVLARRELWRVVEGLKGRTTIVLTTHYMEEAEALADRIGIMQKGRLRQLGTARELKAMAGKASFEEAFVALAAGEDGI